MQLDLNNITVANNLTAFEFGADEFNSSLAYMFGVRDNIMVKYTFYVDLSAESNSRSVKLLDVFEVAYKFDGNVVKVLTSINYFIVSCSDCSTP